MVKYIVITDAINSSRLIENLPMSAGGNSYIHASPLDLNSPSLCLHASDIVVPVDLVNVKLFISIPFVLTCF